ncbi:Gti1/Pac2 family-domain-containing protein [Salix suchowensis]|nr:Gti1/Pac2 family-domain-containing protein [Salix suchowensis]
MQHMQRPTCTNVRIRSTQDAHQIFYAVQLGLLQMVTRRLDADERLALRSGCIYAWEERGPHTEITGLGIERFTEGRRWSPSRVRDEFLFYYEKYTPSTDGNQRSSDSKPPPRDWDPLVKQTYSVYVDTNKGRRKWHLTAYFTQATVDQLGTVDDIDGVGNLEVPDGLFKSTRVSKNRKGEESGRPGESNYTSPDPPPRLSPAAGPQYGEYSQPPALSERSWSSTSSTHRNSDAYYSDDPNSPEGSYRSLAPPHSHTSQPPSQPQSVYSADSPRTPVDAHQPLPPWPVTLGTEINRSDVRAPYSSRHYVTERSYTYFPPTAVESHPSVPRTHSPHDHRPASTNSAFATHAVPQIVVPEATYDAPSPTSSIESDERRGSVGPSRRVDLAPLHALQRSHPYRRDPVDDRALRRLGPRSS